MNNESNHPAPERSETPATGRDGAIELVKRLRIMAGMLTMCERIPFGDDAKLMSRAADFITDNFLATDPSPSTGGEPTIKESSTVARVLDVEAERREWTVGNLLTVSDCDYPGMGGLFAQIWQGDDLIARVYGNSAEEVRERSARIAATGTPAKSAPIAGYVYGESFTPADKADAFMRGEGAPVVWVESAPASAAPDEQQDAQ